MLKLKPNCEWCDKDLPPNASDAMICSYECTFCTSCVDSVLHNVCPNCGGGFCARPIRPSKQHRNGVSLSQQPASNERVQAKWTLSEIEEFQSSIQDIDPVNR